MPRLRFPGSLTADGFLATHWQKQPLQLPGAIDGVDPGLSPDEIAWLATLDDVESRLIFTERSAGATTYRLEQGPFSEDVLRSLPEHDWTLLVQDVEKHLPAFRSLYGLVDFVPDWRIDDLMVSVAAPGGSVGPHRDNYDVFLCQAMGEREWRLLPAGAPVESLAHADLSLLEPFEDDRPFVAGVGDVLYLPPGIPHWGVARELCVTWSIGMRAPQRRDFGQAFARLFAEQSAGVGDGDEDDFFGDADLAIDESAPGQISADALRRLPACFPPAEALDEEAAASLFGATVTEPKPALAPEPLPDAEARRLLAKRPAPRLSVHGMARVAWYRLADSALIFANGYTRRASLLQLDLIQQMCAEREIAGSALETLTSQQDGIELVHWLLTSAALAEAPKGDG